MARGVRTKEPKITRPVGRPTVEQLTAEATLLETARDFQVWQIAFDKIATGKALNGWKIDIKKSGDKLIVVGNLTGVDYALAMLFGRGPGKRPRIAWIVDWIRAKGIRARTPGTRLRDLAYMIARKIGADGTDPPFFTRSKLTSVVQINTGNVLRKAGPAYARQTTDQLMEDSIKKFNQVQLKTNGKVTITTTWKPSRLITLKDLTS